MSYEPMTLGDLRAYLKGLNDSDKIHLPGELSFNELRRRGDNEYIILAEEPEAYLREDFKERNPHVKVAFIRADNIMRKTLRAVTRLLTNRRVTLSLTRPMLAYHSIKLMIDSNFFKCDNVSL